MRAFASSPRRGASLVVLTLALALGAGLVFLPWPHEAPPSVEPAAGAGPVARTYRSVIAAFDPEGLELRLLRLAEAGIDPDAEVPEDLLPPWQEVAPRIDVATIVDQSDWDFTVAEALQWEDQTESSALDPMAPDLNPTARVLAAEQLERLHAMVADYDDQLRAFGEEAAREFERLMLEKWAQGDYVHSPFTAPPLGIEEFSANVITRLFSTSGWYVVVRLGKAEAPRYLEVQARIHELKHHRHQAVVDFIAELP